MKQLYFLFALLFYTGIHIVAQTVDYEFIRKIASQPDSLAKQSLIAAGYVQKNNDFRFIADNKIKAYVSYARANFSAEGQPISYWAFQARGKKVYSPIFKHIKHGAVTTKGTQFGKPKIEYKAKDGFYYYPFEDSMFKGLYWIYASRQSILDP